MSRTPVATALAPLIIYHPLAEAFIHTSARLSLLATGFQFTEGPCWHKNGYLLLSDIPANKIFKVSMTGDTEEFIYDSGFTGEDDFLLSAMVGSDGLAMDPAGNLFVCQQGNHSIARFDSLHRFTMVASEYEGRPFNSPNDIVLKKDGSFYFSDPPYGLKDEMLHPGICQPCAGVYYHKKGTTSLVSMDFRYPNGVCLSADETSLFVSSNHPDEPYLLKYLINKDGSLAHPSIFIQQNADGIKADKNGNLYLATREGILLVSPQGNRLALIPVPEMPTNIAMGGPGGKWLFITAGKSVYSISLLK